MHKAVKPGMHVYAILAHGNQAVRASAEGDGLGTRRRSLLMELHRLVDRKRWIMWGRHAGARRNVVVAGADGETISRGFNRIRIAIASGARQGKRSAGGELVEIGIGAVLREVVTFALGDVVQIHLHAGGGDGWGDGHTRVGRALRHDNLVEYLQAPRGDQRDS